ncbi:sensor histidine kinase [Aquimarina sp. D1M17]|uniref:sensor histidine kinase n=1 Tax=Aquimarina acroporae TaxID=2937283 RepID=UPI0020BE339D|nr:sensor histidine kinase [Aquimarina acroporae]MCK8523390.1 sensor histidine kinase [Aquimarina acroporae]
MPEKQILLIIYFVVIILFFIVFGIIFFIAFQRRKNKLLLEKLKAEQRFEDEIFKSRIEIQEQALKNVSWELHDNIGQLLSTAVMQINILGTSVNEEASESLQDVRNLVGDSLQEIRNLSKTLNHEVIQNVGLEKSIQVELQRFEKLNFLSTSLEVIGEEVHIDPKDEIILYRIVQEFFSNTIKHAEASNINVKLEFTSDNVIIKIQDDGVGFDMNSVQANSGLLNMKSRAGLVNATFEYESAPGKGVLLILSYPTKHKD